MPEETCKVCEKKFKNKYALKTHVEIAHIKEKRFKCTLCPDSAFHQKKILYDHCMYHHVKIKPFVFTFIEAETRTTTRHWVGAVLKQGVPSQL